MKPILSTRELATAIGVSESSIKRWADEGLLVVQKTAGGHRRIAAGDALRFLRQTRCPLLCPEALGLPPLPCPSSAPSCEAVERLWEFLVGGETAKAQGFVIALYLEGRTVAEIVDGPVRLALARLGTLWEQGPCGIFVEHRATEICVGALHQLASLVPAPTGPLLALGGAPEGDPYLLPTLAVATVLASEGISALNLGPNLPLDSLAFAARELRPRLVWLSVSGPSQAGFERRLRRLVDELDGIALALGGRQLPSLPPELAPRVFVGGSLVELAAYARGWSAAVPGRSTVAG